MRQKRCSRCYEKLINYHCNYECRPTQELLLLRTRKVILINRLILILLINLYYYINILYYYIA